MWFFISLLGMILILPFLFKSFEHDKLEVRYGEEKGKKIGKVLGIISGYAYFGFWIGVWISPQPDFSLPLLQAPELNFVLIQIPFLHFLVGVCFLVIGGYLGVAGMREVTIEVAQTHQPKQVVISGVYSWIRHPQYMGGILSHIGITILLSGLYSLLSTPVVVLINYLVARKEEQELLREFGSEYNEYRQAVPMFIPKSPF